MKKLTFIFGIICLIVIILSISLNLIKEKKETVQTNSLYITNKTIVLDAGHGLPDEGEILLTKYR